MWAGQTEAPRERVVSGPSARRGLSVAWRGRLSEYLAALGLERAGWRRLLTRKHDPRVRSTIRIGRACGREREGSAP